MPSTALGQLESAWERSDQIFRSSWRPRRSSPAPSRFASPSSSTWATCPAFAWNHLWRRAAGRPSVNAEFDDALRAWHRPARRRGGAFGRGLACARGGARLPRPGADGAAGQILDEPVMAQKVLPLRPRARAHAPRDAALHRPAAPDGAEDSTRRALGGAVGARPGKDPRPHPGRDRCSRGGPRADGSAGTTSSRSTRSRSPPSGSTPSR